MSKPEPTPKTGYFPWAPEPIRRVAGRVKYAVRESRWHASPVGRENAARLEALRGAHAGRRAFVIGNGPSLNAVDLGRLQGEVTIGSNGIFLKQDEGFTPTYYTVEDWLVAEDRALWITEYRGPTKLFPRDCARYLPEADDTIWVDFPRQYRGFPRFSDDFARRAFWGGTVTFMNLQLAWHLGCTSVILIGVDHSYSVPEQVPEDLVITSHADDVNHFDPSYFGAGFRWHDPMVHRMELAYLEARRFAQARGWTILNATAGGKLEVFPRVDFDDLFRR